MALWFWFWNPENHTHTTYSTHPPFPIFLLPSTSDFYFYCWCWYIDKMVLCFAFWIVFILLSLLCCTLFFVSRLSVYIFYFHLYDFFSIKTPSPLLWIGVIFIRNVSGGGRDVSFRVWIWDLFLALFDVLLWCTLNYELWNGVLFIGSMWCRF